MIEFEFDFKLNEESHVNNYHQISRDILPLCGYKECSKHDSSYLDF